MKKILLTSLVLAGSAFAAKPEPLTLWIMPNGATPQEKMEQLLEDFSTKTGIPTAVRVLDWGEAWNRISTTLAGKGTEKAPDVLQLGTTWIPYFGSRGEIKPLNRWLDKIDSTRFEPVSWNTSHIIEDSTIYSIPWFIDIRPILGNKRILKKNGIDAKSIDTYPKFLKALKKINDSGETLEDGVKIKSYAFPGKSDWNILHNFTPWIWSNGGDFIARDSAGKWHATILDENAILGIARYLNFVIDTLVSTESLQRNTAEIVQQFNNGEVAFIVNTSEIVTQTRFESSKGGLANSKIGQDSIEVFPIPQGEKGSISFIGGSNLAIPAGNNRPEAIKLLMYLIDDQTLDAYTRHIGLLPTSHKVLEEWAKDPDFKVMLEALKTGKTYTAIPKWGEVEQILVQMFSAIWESQEMSGLYSEEKLYEILKAYSQKINEHLEYQDSSLMTMEQFREAWDKAIKKDHSNTNVPAQEAEPAENGFNPTPVFFGVAVVIGFFLSYRKRVKKEKK